MDAQVSAALIEAGATVIASGMGVAGVWAIVKHRSKVKRLAQQVEAYYHYEAELVREIYRLQNDGAELPEKSLAAVRGQLRRRLSKLGQRPDMTARQAAELRDSLL